MIPEAAITHWRNVVPWPQDAQVEQDLILSRALVEIFQEPILSKALLLRGGTALYKLFVTPPRRYSEDIDLVQASSGPIRPVLDAIRARLDPVLGAPLWERSRDSVTLRYRMESEIPPVTHLRLKVEINTREHFSVFGAAPRSFSIRSPWFEGRAEIQTYTMDELLATKLRRWSDGELRDRSCEVISGSATWAWPAGAEPQRTRSAWILSSDRT